MLKLIQTQSKFVLLILFLISHSYTSFSQQGSTFLLKYKLNDDNDWLKKRELYYLNFENPTEEDIVTYYNRGIENFNLQNFKQAISDFRKSSGIEIYNTPISNNNEQNSYPELMIAMCFTQMDHIDSANFYYNKCIKKYPRLEEPYLQIARLSSINNNFIKGLNYCDSALMVNPGSSDAHYIKGVTLYKMEETRECIKELKTSLKSDPSNIFNHILLGDIYYQEDKKTQSVNEYTKAIKIDSSIVITYCKRALVNIILGNYNKSLNDLELAFELDSTDAGLYYVSGSIHLVKNNPKKGLDHISKSINLQKTDTAEYYSQSVDDLELYEILLSLNNDQLTFNEKKVGYAFLDIILERGLKDPYAKIIKLSEQNNSSLFINRVYNYLLFHEFRGEMTDLKINLILATNPEILPIKLMKAYIYEREDNYQKCIDITSEIIDVAPYYTRAYYIRAFSYIKFNMVNKAFPDISMFEKLNPTSYDAALLRGLAFMKIKMYPQALANFKSIPIKNYNDELYYYEKVIFCYNNNNQIDSSLFYANKMVDDNPNNSKAFRLRGDLYFDINDFKKAEDDYQKALQITNNKNSYYYYLLGLTRYNLELYNKAMTNFHRSINLNPNYSKPYNGIAKIYFSKQKYDKSIEYNIKATKHNENYIDAMYGIGLAMLFIDDYNETEKYYIRIAKYDISKNKTINNDAIADLQKLVDTKNNAEKAQNILDVLNQINNTQ